MIKAEKYRGPESNPRMVPSHVSGESSLYSSALPSPQALTAETQASEAEAGLLQNGLPPSRGRRWQTAESSHGCDCSQKPMIARAHMFTPCERITPCLSHATYQVLAAAISAFPGTWR